MNIKYFDGINYHQYPITIIDNMIIYLDEEHNKTTLLIKEDSLEVIKKGIINYHILHQKDKITNANINIKIAHKSMTYCVKIITKDLQITKKKVIVSFAIDDQLQINSWEFCGKNEN